MPSNWKAHCSAPNFSVEADTVSVSLEGGRTQKVNVEITDDGFRFSSVVARQKDVAEFQEAELRAWLRNRSMHLVAFRLDRRGRMIGESWVHSVGLTAHEFRLYLTTIAIECDRFEYQITGRDEE